MTTCEARGLLQPVLKQQQQSQQHHQQQQQQQLYESLQHWLQMFLYQQQQVLEGEEEVARE